MAHEAELGFLARSCGRGGHRDPSSRHASRSTGSDKAELLSLADRLAALAEYDQLEGKFR